MKFVLAGYFGFGNFGDEAILKYAVDILHYYYKTAQISIITENPLYAKKVYSATGVKRFDFKNIINEIKTCDYLIFPGGSVLQDITSVKSLGYYLSLISLALFFKKKVIMLSQGFGPINNNFMRKLTFKLLKKVSLITLRDEKSYDTLMSNGVVKSELTADLLWAFTSKPKTDETPEIFVYGDISCNIDKKKVGIQLRNWADLTEEKLNIIAKSVLNNFHYIEYDYKLICLQENSDLQILIDLGKIMHETQPKAKIELCRGNDIEKNIELLQSMDYMIAMRFHAGLCTINSEKPILMLSYDPKTEEFCNELGLEFIDIKELNENKFLAGLKWLKEFNPTRTALKTNILVKKSQQNADFLVKEIG
ncbi:MAG: polysaccharide pyruvyl transferase CsaB [Candidatus Gastranaerophilales bacterium]|nr:polysaccharide pyruvyl transferase CsaB [Candidatus Gastranaerophilales bacterium]